jgi:uncharacterized membrane protein YdjX (TVP38/TMEM64 family)
MTRERTPTRARLLARGASLTSAIALVVAGVLVLPWKPFLLALPAWVESAGPWGPLLLGAVYVLASLVSVPGSLLTLAAGYTLGLVYGAVTVSLASTLSACIAFLLSRFAVRGWIIDKLAHGPKFHALDEAIRQQGFKIVLLVRLSPFLPFAALNYSLGATRIAFRDFAVATWLGMIPSTLAYVYLGTTIRTLTAEISDDPAEEPTRRILFWVGLAATLAVAMLLTHIARKDLRQLEPSRDRQGAGMTTAP